MSVYYVPSTNLMGRGCLKELAPLVKDQGFNKAMVVTDKFLNQTGVAGKVLAELDSIHLEYIVYDEENQIQPLKMYIRVRRF